MIVYLPYIPVHIKQQECNDQQQQLEEDVKPSRDALLGKEAEQMLIKALDGFLLVLSEEGDITYVSANVTELLGLNQVRNSIRKRNGMEDSLEVRHLIPLLCILSFQTDILSQPIWDYAHQVSIL